MSKRAKSASPDRVAKMRELLEQFGVSAAGGSPLKLDEATGVIFRAKVLGRYSRNNHGLVEAENGSEYSPACMRSALAEYEGKKVKCNHPADRANPGKERPVEDTFGVLRNCVIESDEKGEPAIWADLHCLTSHPMYPRVVEDVKKGLGVYGLSHNASARRERFDRAARRLVIEELAQVRSVDLVDKPATNRTLWESEQKPMPTTLRNLLESRLPKWSKPRRAWARVLLEDDGMAPMTDAPVGAEAEGADPDEMLWSGFKAAIMAVLDASDATAEEKAKRIAKYIKSHDKLTSGCEPEGPDEVEEGEECDKGDKDKQESEELAQLRAEKAARQLCEGLALANPTTAQVAAVAGVRDDKIKRELIESFKAAPARPTHAGKPPRSAAPGAAGKKDQQQKPRETLEGEKDEIAESFRILRG